MLWYLRIHRNKAPTRLRFLRNRNPSDWRAARVENLRDTKDPLWSIPGGWVNQNYPAMYNIPRFGGVDNGACTGLLAHGRFIAGYLVSPTHLVWLDKVFTDDEEALAYGRVMARKGESKV